MKSIVSQRKLSVHKEHEVLLKLEAAGLNDKLAQRVIDSKGNQLAIQVVELIRGGKVEAAIISFKHDKAKDDWTLLEDTPFDGKQFTPDIVEFLKPGGLLKSGELYVNGEVMKQRAKELNAHLGQRHAEYLLEHQDLIPKEWRDKYYLVFPGTVWRDSDGRRDVPCLLWCGGRWSLRFAWLSLVWRSRARLVRPRG